MSTLIRNGTVITAVDEYVGDILIEDEKIRAIGKNLDVKADNIIDAKGKYIMPGGVDQHTHFDFSFGDATVFGWEGSNAALVGGTTTVVDFVNQKIGWSMKDSVDEYVETKVNGKAMCDYSFHGVVYDPSDALFEEIPKLPEIGIPSIKLFMAYKGHPYHCDDAAIFKALQASKEAGVTIMVHAENADVIDVLQKQLVAKGKTEPKYHAVSRPPLVEAEATQRAIYLAMMADAPIFVVHVTCKEAMEVIRDAYIKGVPAYGETCSHYLVLDTDNLSKPNFEGAKYVCSPALRGEEHREALWEAIKKGWLKCVSSDHCSFSWKEHKVLGRDNFINIPNGAPGLQDRLAILWTYGVEKDKISRQKLVELFATVPAKINGLFPQKGTIAVGSDADIVIFDPEWKGVISNKTSLHGVDYSSYEGMEQIGRAEKVFLRGNLTVDDGKFTGELGQGQFIPGKPFGLAYQER
ncbi:MAG: dihydropyrimidinase [Epulopiscium sp.]|nr:dihydropyrimidinase [Candidatus Epulonipiscium sp.]